MFMYGISAMHELPLGRGMVGTSSRFESLDPLSMIALGMDELASLSFARSTYYMCYYAHAALQHC